MNEEKMMDRRTRRTVSAIKNAFVELAEERGVEKVTVSDIAERADINRKTFYHHFESIEDLTNDLIREECEQTIELLRGGLIVKDDSIDVQRLFETISLLLLDVPNRRIACLINADPGRLIQHIEPVYIRIMTESMPELFSGLSDQHLRYILTFLCSGLITSFRRWYEDESELEMSALTSVLSAFLAGGLPNIKQAVVS